MRHEGRKSGRVHADTSKGVSRARLVYTVAERLADGGFVTVTRKPGSDYSKATDDDGDYYFYAVRKTCTGRKKHSRGAQDEIKEYYLALEEEEEDDIDM